MAIPMDQFSDTERDWPKPTEPAGSLAINGLRGQLENGYISEEDLDADAFTMQKIRARIKPAETTVQQPDDLGLFIRDAARYPLLDKNEEVALAKAIEKSKMVAGLLQDDQEWIARDHRTLSRTINQGVEAKELFILTNLRLVMAISKKFPQSSGMSRLDLIQEGTFGLHRAVEKFDWNQGFKFSTYAYNWIYQSMQRAVEQRARLVRIPAGRELELRAAMNDGMDDETIMESSDLWMVAAAVSPLSLDKPMTEDNDKDLKSTIHDPRENVEAEVINSMETKRIINLLNLLPEQDAEVIRLHFGIDTGIPATFQQITDHFQKPRGWAHYRYRKSIKRIREVLERTTSAELDH